MVRAPCCEKMGLKKGPWTPEEDQILIDYIKLYGHGNWRALPKQAGLLRCGKSCRLRWTNYLRPDIKRGNFTREEEDIIINLHEMLGNRWAAIAARLPGRTDNEIKNVWHTHLKKRLEQSHGSNGNKRQANFDSSKNIKKEQEPVNFLGPVTADSPGYRPVSPSESSSEISTVTTSENNSNICMMKIETREDFSEIDENFWSEVLSVDNSSMASDFQVVGSDPQPYRQYFPSFPLATLEPVNDYGSNLYDNDKDTNMDFWYDLYTRAGDLPELPEI